MKNTQKTQIGTRLGCVGRRCGKLAAAAVLGTALGSVAGLGGAAAQDSGAEAAMGQDEITFTSWTGPYMRSQMLGFVRPYEAASGARVNVEHYAGGIDEIRDQVESANVVWDVVDLTQADSLRACKEGLLEIVEDVALPDGVDGTNYRDDFVEGALNPCGIGVIVWATVYGYNKTAFGDNPPSTVADFFDVKKYPGRRAIRNDPTVIMEWALIADGVPQEEVYGILETPEGMKRALAKMDAIKPGLVLWEDGLEPVRLLNDDEVVMSSVWATTGATAAAKEGRELRDRMGRPGDRARSLRHSQRQPLQGPGDRFHPLCQQLGIARQDGQLSAQRADPEVLPRADFRRRPGPAAQWPGLRREGLDSVGCPVVG